MQIFSFKSRPYLDLGGNSIFDSMNYDKVFELKKGIYLSSRIGYGYLSSFNGHELKFHVIPIEFSGLFSISREKHFIEIGSGVSIYSSLHISMDHRQTTQMMVLRLGYRFQNPTGGMFYRAGFTPMYDYYTINPYDDIDYHSWLLFGGVSVGYTF